MIKIDEKDDYKIEEIPSSSGEEGKPPVCNICNYNKAMYSVKSEYEGKIKIVLVCKNCLQYFEDNEEGD